MAERLGAARIEAVNRARAIAEETVLLLRRKNMTAKDIETAVQAITAMIELENMTDWMLDDEVQSTRTAIVDW